MPVINVVIKHGLDSATWVEETWDEDEWKAHCKNKLNELLEANVDVMKRLKSR